MGNLNVLTERTKGVARWLVEQHRACKLPEEFHIIWYGGGYHITGQSRSDDEVPAVTEHALRSLTAAGLLLGDQNQYATMNCTMLGTLFDAVDSDFAPFHKEHSAFPQALPGTVHINVQGSVGILNTGTIDNVKSISVSISHLMRSGNTDIAQALKALTVYVAESQELSSEQRISLLENLEELSRQATLDAAHRAKPGVLRSLISGIVSTISTAGGLAEVWKIWRPTIKQFFGL